MNIHPHPIASTTFEGITWTLEDIKGIAEDMIKEGVSFASFLPSLKFKTTTNIIDPYIPFSKKDKLTLVFYDLEIIKVLLINLAKNSESEKAKISLSISVPSNNKFNEEEYNNLLGLLLIDIKCKTQFYYFSQAIMNKLIAEESGN